MRRPVLLGAAWLVAAAAAVGLGFLAVSLVDASASPTGSFLGAAAAPTTSTASTAPSRAAATGRQVTGGGTVIADCTSGRPVLAGVPAAGWWSDDSAEPGKREFTNGSQNIEVRASCVNGSPSFAVEGPTTHDKGGLTGGHSADDPGGGSTSGKHGGHGGDG